MTNKQKVKPRKVLPNNEGKRKPRHVTWANVLKECGSETEFVKQFGWGIIQEAHQIYFGKPLTTKETYRRPKKVEQYVKSIIPKSSSNQRIDYYVKKKDGLHILSEFADMSGIYDAGHCGQSAWKAFTFRGEKVIAFTFGTSYKPEILNEIKDWNSLVKSLNIKIIPFKVSFEEDRYKPDELIRANLEMIDLVDQKVSKNSSKRKKIAFNFTGIKNEIGSKYEYAEGTKYLSIKTNTLTVYVRPKQDSSECTIWTEENASKKRPGIMKTWSQISKKHNYKLTKNKCGILSVNTKNITQLVGLLEKSNFHNYN